MPTISSQPSAETLRKLRFGRLIPALFTRMSMRPCCLRIFCAAAATALRSATSSGRVSALLSFCAFFSVSTLRPESTTCAPARANSIPAASPIPEPPPVIQATLSFSVLGCAKEILLLFFCHFPRAARVLQHVERPLHGRTLEKRVAPLPQRRELLDVHALALRKAQPRHGRHVGDGVLVAREVFRFPQPPVDHAVQPVRLVLVAVHRVFDLLRRVAEEVVRLAEHRAD